MYSLGLVLYEIYTGRKAFTATNLAELRQQKETHTPRAISELREGIDPVVERLIRRCMDCDPNARPSSAAQLALALPGGDPLAAALAAGETPSPEMVAASGTKDGLRPAVAWGLLALIVIGTLAAMISTDRVFMHRRIPFENSPEALAERSRLFLKKIGYSEKPSNSIYGFMGNWALTNDIANSERIAARSRNPGPTAILFWYRQNSHPIQGILTGNNAPDTPPLRYPGERLVILDTEGHLVSFRSIPQQTQSTTGAAPAADWPVFFTEAGLDISKWAPTENQWVPTSYADAKVAWNGTLPNQPDIPIRIEAASFQGKPVSFDMIAPWTQPFVNNPTLPSKEIMIGLAGIAFFFLPAFAAGVFFARRNLRLGRGDRRSATRLAVCILILSVVVWLLQLPRASIIALLLGPYAACLIWILYMAVEPFVRRKWPQVLVSWMRLLSGEWKDPLLGRDMLIGFVFGLFFMVAFASTIDLFTLRPFVLGTLLPTDFDSFIGTRFVIAGFGYHLGRALFIGLAWVCFLVLLKALLRSQIAMIVASILIGTILIGLSNGFLFSLLVGAVWIYLLMRFGFIAAISFLFGSWIFGALPMTLQVSAWYAGYGFLALGIFAAMVLYAFRISLGGRSILSGSHLDD